MTDTRGYAPDDDPETAARIEGHVDRIITALRMDLPRTTWRCTQCDTWNDATDTRCHCCGSVSGTR